MHGTRMPIIRPYRFLRAARSSSYERAASVIRTGSGEPPPGRRWGWVTMAPRRCRRGSGVPGAGVRAPTRSIVPPRNGPRAPAPGRRYRAARAFFSAFAACLNARTRSSDAPSTTSATDRVEPSSPYAPAASRQPGGATPRCLPRSATKICAFCVPKPGRAVRRRSSVAPSGTSRHSPAASPPYRSTTSAASARPRPAMAARGRGSGCGAGGGAGRRHPPGHGGRVAVQRGRAGEDGGEGLGVVRGDRGGVEPVDAEAGGEPGGGGERPLHRELLVEQHADEQRERVAVEQRIGLGVLRDLQHGSSPARRRSEYAPQASATPVLAGKPRSRNLVAGKWLSRAPRHPGGGGVGEDQAVLPALSPRTVDALRTALDRAGYRTDGVRALLGREAHAALGRGEPEPAYRA